MSHQALDKYTESFLKLLSDSFIHPAFLHSPCFLLHRFPLSMYVWPVPINPIDTAFQCVPPEFLPWPCAVDPHSCSQPSSSVLFSSYFFLISISKLFCRNSQSFSIQRCIAVVACFIECITQSIITFFVFSIIDCITIRLLMRHEGTN